MKICLISPYSYKLFHPHDKKVLPFSGAEVQQYQLGKALAKDPDFEVDFIVGDFYKEQPKSEPHIYKAIKCYKRIFLWDTLQDIWNLSRAMKKINADIYLIRGGGSLAGIIAFLVKKIFKKKFIYSSAHDRDSNLNFFKTHPFYINFLFKYALKNADQVICQHPDQKKAFKKNLGIEATMIRSMYPIPSSKSSHAKRKHILWVSRLADWKQPNYFAELAIKFTKEKFLLITSSDASSFKTQFKNLKNLEVKKEVPFKEINKYFQEAKVFVNTSVFEGFPNTFVQAAKNGTPIISLQVNPEGMLEKYQMGKCAKGNLGELTKDLKEILGNEKLWQKMSKNAYNYAQKNHDINKIVGKYKKIFKS